jgi:hypothetical protein
MKVIPLTRGKEALVDDCDYEYLTQWSWCFVKAEHHQSGYAQRKQKIQGKPTTIHMHRLVAERSGLEVNQRRIDHIDGNGLNNQRANLRVATDSQNKANRGKQQNNTSGFKGVTWDREHRKWRAQIRVLRRQYCISRHDDPRDAARAYNEAALKHFGEFACLNPA